MITAKLTGEAEDLLKLELVQTWNHYRHLEESRAKYLNFFYTLMAASVGFTLTQIRLGVQENPTPLLIATTSAFILILFLVFLLLLTSVVRIGYVLGAYEAVMKGTHEYFFRFDSSALELWAIREYIPSAVCKGIFSIQTSSTYLLVGVCSILATLELALGGSLALTNQQLRWYSCFPFAGFLIMMPPFVLVVRSMRVASRDFEARVSGAK